MANCVNKSSVEFQELAQQTNLNPVILAAKISIWQDENGLENFPTADDIAPKEAKALTAKLKEVMKQMGVSFQYLHDYAKGNPGMVTKGVNGVADLAKRVIAVAQGMEDTVLTEEVVHIATAILEQSDPKFITALISHIDKYAIYKKTLEDYKGNKNYQTPDGKPDIRKIKKEAVDKLIAEAIISKSEGSPFFPELALESQRTLIQTWWNTILSYIRSLYSKSPTDLFETAATKILDENIGSLEEAGPTGVFYQLANNKNVVGANVAVDEIINTITGYDARMKLNPDSVNDKRHYTFDDQRVANSVTQKLDKEKKALPERTEEQKASDNQKRLWGTAGHEYLEQYIGTNLIDKDGFKKAPTSVPITSVLEDAHTEKLRIFAEELINSYPEGTRFLIEKKVINQREKGLLASTIDFIAVSPVEHEDGTQDYKIDILDWKFTDIDKNKQEDIDYMKQEGWKKQMGEYTRMMYQYGVKPAQLKKARMIPFIMNYDNVVPGDKKSGLAPRSIQIGKIDSLTETVLYLLPVPINAETTGNDSVDDLLKKLRTHWQQLYSKRVIPEAKAAKLIQMNQLSRAIRSIHVSLNFSPMVNVGRTFLNTSRATIDSFKNVDYSKLSKEQIESKLQELLEFKATAQNFTVIDEAFISQFGDTDLSDENVKLLRDLKHISSSAKARLKEILDLQKEYVLHLAERENFVNAKNKTSFFDPEREISGFIKNFVEGSRLPAKLINLASNVIMRTNRLANTKFISKFEEFQKVLLPLEKAASSVGKRAFDLIGTVDQNGLHLIKKIDKQFWKDVIKAKEDKNKKFLMDNMDMDEFNRLAEESIKKGIEEINMIEFSQDKTQNDYIRNGRIKRLKNSIDINRKDFFGYDEYVFNHIFRQVVKEEDHLSEEYKRMAGNKAALDAWNFFTAMNVKARDLGYIDKQGMSFFPLVEASIVDKFKQTTNFGSEFADFFKDLYTVKINEEQAYSKKDAETGELKKAIPKYFTTKGNVAVEKLSVDLNKVGALWIKSLTDYEAKQSIENTLLTVQAVERSKKTLLLNEQGELVSEGGKFKVNENLNKNADILEAIVNDGLYDLDQDLGSLGNISIQNLAKKTTKDTEAAESRAVSVKKGLRNADTLMRALAVGLKPLVAIPNWVGFNFHAIITGGNMYNFSTFSANNIKVTTGIGMSMEDKALLHYVTMSPTELLTEMRRKAAKKQGLLTYLSTWSFTDAMMVTNSAPERKLVLANAKSFNDNAIVIDGKIVNARQYLKKQDRAGKYKLSMQQRRELEKTFDKRVDDLLARSTKLTSLVKISGDNITIEGVTPEEIADYSVKVSEFSRNLNGAMNEDNKAGYRRDTIFSSFMMFKNWIPKLVTSRFGDVKYNYEIEEWEYGRSRAFAKLGVEYGLKSLSKMREIINGSEEGLQILREMLDNKKQDHFNRTGQVLEISEEEFFDLMRSALVSEFKELGVLFGTFGAVMLMSAAEPPETATALEKNRYKWWARLFNKINEEISFYYLPTSMESVTKGSVLPSLGLITKMITALNAFRKEAYGVVADDQELIDKTYPTKYFLNLIPGLAQFQNELLPYIAPELAKSMGIRVTEQARRQ